MGEASDGLVTAGIISADLGKRMRGAVGFRNIAIHSYQATDWEIVYSISRDGLEDFRALTAAMAKLL